MRIDFSEIEEMDDFSPLPAGKYLSSLSEVEETETQSGDDMWKLRFSVEEGDHQGRYIFDNVVFSDAALKRAKLICSRLGLDTSGELDLTPELIKGRSCYVTAESEEYEDQEGNTKRRNVVPFAGYETAESTTEDADKEPPF